jgi:hypothetical protein
MNKLPRKSLSLLGCCLVLLSFLTILLTTAPAQAGGPQWAMPGGSSILPGEETPIHLLAEIVGMNIRAATEADNQLIKLSQRGFPSNLTWFSAVAEVESDFTLKNPTNEPVNVTAWFPLASTLENINWDTISDVPYIDTLQVHVDGESIEYNVSDLPNPKGDDKPPLPWASFPLTFQGGEEKVVHLSYKLLLPSSRTGNEMAVYYSFHPETGWAGPVEQTELTLNLPYPASQETLAGIPSDSLRMPPAWMTAMKADLPANTELAGNQARWTWTDLQPGTRDDFAIWLLQPEKWQQLETARMAVQENPKAGQTWLDLAYIYYSLSRTDVYYDSVFYPSFLPPGVIAFQKAADLLPKNPAPHAGLGLFALAPYLEQGNAPAEVLQYAQDEYEIVKQLEAEFPGWKNEAGMAAKLIGQFEHVLDAYPNNRATSIVKWTADVALLLTPSAIPTRKPTSAPTPTNTLTLTATQTKIPTSTAIPVPSTTPPPAPTTISATSEKTGDGMTVIMITAGGVILLGVMGYLVWMRLRKKGKTL